MDFIEGIQQSCTRQSAWSILQGSWWVRTSKATGEYNYYYTNVFFVLIYVIPIDISIEFQIVVGMGNASLYCQVLSNIYSDPNYQSLNHWSILQTLSRKGVQLNESSDLPLTETVLIQTNPLRIVSTSHWYYYVKILQRFWLHYIARVYFDGHSLSQFVVYEWNLVFNVHMLICYCIVVLPKLFQDLIPYEND